MPLAVLTTVLFLAALAVGPDTVTNRVRRLRTPDSRGSYRVHTGSLRGLMVVGDTQSPPERHHLPSTLDELSEETHTSERPL